MQRACFISRWRIASKHGLMLPDEALQAGVRYGHGGRVGPTCSPRQSCRPLPALRLWGACCHQSSAAACKGMNITSRTELTTSGRVTIGCSPQCCLGAAPLVSR